MESESNAQMQKFKTVHIGMQFGKDFTNDQLAKIFSEVGTVVSAKIVRKQNGDPKNFAFVEFESHDMAVKAVAEMNNKLIETGNTKRRMGVVFSTSEGPKPKKEKPQSEQVVESSTLLVRKLAWKVRQKGLKEHFSKFGTITTCRVLKGYGFVGFEDVATAKKAMEEMDGKDIEGHEIQVIFSDPNRRNNKKKKAEKKPAEEASPEKTTKKSKRRRKKKPAQDKPEEENPKGKKKKKGGKKQEEAAEPKPSGGKKGKKAKGKRTPEDSKAETEKAKKPKPRRPRKRIFIKNLPTNLTEKEVSEHFSQYGEVKKCNVISKEDKDTHIGYVQFVEADAATKAKEAGPAKIGDGDTEVKVYWARNSFRGRRRARNN